jgi:two-component system response regulator HydG
MERAVSLAQSKVIDCEHLPQRIRCHSSRHVLVSSDDVSDLVPLAEVERRYIHSVLRATAGDARRAAGCLGIRLDELRQRLAAYTAPAGRAPEGRPGSKQGPER